MSYPKPVAASDCSGSIRPQVSEFDRGSSDDAFEFCLFGHTFVRFIRALNSIQAIVAFGRKQLRYFIHAPSGLAFETSDTVQIPDGLADLEPMIAQMALRIVSIFHPGPCHCTTGRDGASHVRHLPSFEVASLVIGGARS
jgi:hypothetical protein